ncbi:MAG TPA: zinc-dependent metalloprotease, partial [Gemmataceae bacterium]|nr:zinc-dependent metalloprotease [Gemmataceae bacterium]
DTLQATALGLKNLDRVVDMLVPATTQLGEDYSLLKETYNSVLSHRARWFGAVSTMVGGVVENRSLGGRGSETFQRLPKDKQQQAVAFLTQHAFTTPKKLLQPAIVNRFSYYGVANQIMNQQKSLLQSLLSARRFQLLMDAEVIDAKQAYSAMQFLTDVQNGVWSEVVAQAQTSAPEPVVDVCRRNLQRAYLEHIKNELNPKETPALTLPRPILPTDDGLFSASNRGTDFRAVARAALRTLTSQLDAAIPRAQDVMTRLHLQDCRREVELILNPKN